MSSRSSDLSVRGSACLAGALASPPAVLRILRSTRGTSTGNQIACGILEHFAGREILPARTPALQRGKPLCIFTRGVIPVFPNGNACPPPSVGGYERCRSGGVFSFRFPVSALRFCPRYETFSAMTPSGGSVSETDCCLPPHGIGSEWTPPKFPTLLPPYSALSVFRTSCQKPGAGTPMR